jgi:pimeloyl-ACP methyl ester carboxylesterase
MRQPPEGYALTCEALADAKAAEAWAIRRPTLLLTGDEDAAAPASVGRALAERIEGGRFVALAKCGHWVSIERAKEVNQQLREFYAGQARQNPVTGR